MNKMFKLSVLSFAVVSLFGCASISIPNLNLETKDSFDKEEVLEKNKKFESLQNWWGQFNNESLIYLIGEAQKNSPTISSSLLNIKNYELNLKINDANNLPVVSGNVNASRSVSSISGSAYDAGKIGIQTSWELDLFNKNGIEKAINEKKYFGAKALWHDARVLVAANTAKSYFSYKMCKEYLSNLEKDYSSRISQKDLTKLNVKVGLETKSSEYMAEAKLSQAKTSLINKEIECETETKGLVALTGVKEEELKKIIDKKENINLNLYVPSVVPGDLISQRPDIFNAKKNLEVAYYNITSVQLKAYPSISISGNIASNILNNSSISTNGTTWSIGPLSISLPIFDGGKIKAEEVFANEKIVNERTIFANNVRQAIKEVEISLLNLSRVEEKAKLIEASADNYEKVYESTLKKYEVGIASLYELEDAKISYLNAKNAKVSQKKEILNYWIDLYKAVGGGFKGVENEK